MNTSPESVGLPTLSDLSIVESSTVVTVHNRLMDKFVVSREAAVKEVLLETRKQRLILNDTLRQYNSDRFGHEIFLGSINTTFAVMAGVRRFLLSAVDKMIEQDGGGKKSAHRTELLGAEAELEKEMAGVVDRIKESVRHEHFPLVWDDSKGFHLHVPNISDTKGFGF